jgi:hypothetical protein
LIFDINGDGNVGLADTILILKTLTGIAHSSSIHKTTDMNGDEKMGTQEAVYALQVVSEIRSE